MRDERETSERRAKSERKASERRARDEGEERVGIQRREIEKSVKN